jgi:hypothetical protein
MYNQFRLSTLSFLMVVTILSACTIGEFEPMEITYEVVSDNENAIALVHEYYGYEIGYRIYGADQMEITRQSGVGETHEWWTGDSLLVREQNDPYCSCVAVHDMWLTEFLKEPLIETLTLTGKTEEILGYACKEYLGVTPEGDSTYMMVTEKVPNGWYVIPSLPGMPLRYSYKLMGSTISYEAVKSSPLVGKMNYEGWRRNCVEQSAQGFVRFEEDSVVVNADGLFLSGLVLDAGTKNPMLATIQVDETRENNRSQSQMLLSEGNFDLLLRAGSVYYLQYSADGFAAKQLEIDLTPMPSGLGMFSLELDMSLFESSDPAVIEFLQRTPIGKAAYSVEEDNVLFDLEYTQGVKVQLGLLMGEES